MDPWQQIAVNTAFSVRADGKWSAFELGVLVARQNGKGAILEAITLAGLFLFDDRLILHSAHEFKTAAEAFLRVLAVVENSDELRKACKKPRTSHGEEGIERLNGARLRFVARSRSSGRGFSGDRVILDEAQELPRSAMSALLPTLRTRPNPQVVYTGTVPAPENNAEQWTSVRDRGRAGSDRSLAWLEWSAGERLDDLDNRAAWAAANPALGYRVNEEAMERERATLDDEGFARELLSLWGPLQTQQVIDPDVWQHLTDSDSQPLDPVAFAADITPDRQRGSISLAGRRADGRLHVETVQNERGVSWIVPRLVELSAKWNPCALVIDPGSPAGSLITDLQDLGVEPLLTSTRDVGQACGAFYDMAVDDKLRHLGDARLTGALASARKRPLGDSGAWAWHRKDASTDITPLVAATLALHGFARNGPTLLPPPKRRMVVR